MRLFAALPRAPRRSILFVGVTGEEMGLLGSDCFATRPTVPREKIVANLCLDMPFFFHPLRDVVPYGAEHSSLAREVQAATAYLGLGLAKDPFPEQTLFIRSDHLSFVRQGIPALFLKSGTQSGDPAVDGLQVNLDWRAKVYHTPQDDMGQPFNFDAAAQHVQLQFLIGYLLAQADQRPTWNPNDFFGRKFGKATPVK
jgi:Zn-dependent M28 family amino/carboxypeptidase